MQVLSSLKTAKQQNNVTLIAKSFAVVVGCMSSVNLIRVLRRFRVKKKKR